MSEQVEIPPTALTPAMGARRDDRFDACGHNPTMTEGNECGYPATWHIIWDLEAENSAACEKHYQRAKEQYVFVCAHQRGPDCMMPGSVILFDENRCVVEGDPIDGPVLQTAQLLVSLDTEDS